MATLNAKQRNNLPDSAFAYIDSSGGRHLPIHDEAHCRAAMSRFNQTAFESASAKATARRKILAAAKRFGIDVANFSDVLTTEATFADAAYTAPGYVIRPAKIFEAGEYPDKDFSLSEEEMVAAVADFEPVPLDLEHMSTVLDGKLGSVQRIYASGTSLMGDVCIPQWLDSTLDKRGLSATWDRASKRLVRAALVRTPRVTDAALMAAFSAHSDAHTPDQPRRRARMNLKQWLTGKADEEGVTLDDLEAAFSDPSAELAKRDAEITRLKEQQAQHEARFAAEAQARRTAEAVTFCSSLVEAKRLTPGAAQALQPLVERIAQHDSTVTFAEGETSTLALLKAFTDSLPDLAVFTTNHIDPKAAFALGNQSTTPGADGKPAPMTEERLNELLNMTPLGRSAANGKH